MTKHTMATTIPTIARIQAMLTAVPAMPEKPRTAAINAMMRKVTAQPIMDSSFGLRSRAPSIKSGTPLLACWPPCGHEAIAMPRKL